MTRVTSLASLGAASGSGRPSEKSFLRLGRFSAPTGLSRTFAQIISPKNRENIRIISAKSQGFLAKTTRYASQNLANQNQNQS
jgi:hypothetical protein